MTPPVTILRYLPRFHAGLSKKYSPVVWLITNIILLFALCHPCAPFHWNFNYLRGVQFFLSDFVSGAYNSLSFRVVLNANDNAHLIVGSSIIYSRAHGEIIRRAPLSR